MRALVDWAFYRDMYGGEAIDEEAFGRFARRAAWMLDALTFGRIDKTYARSKAVKMACCAVAETLHADGDAGACVTRERLGEYEVGYGGEGATLRKRCLDAARVYLWRTGLLSMAVRG